MSVPSLMFSRFTVLTQIVLSAPITGFFSDGESAFLALFAGNDPLPYIFATFWALRLGFRLQRFAQESIEIILAERGSQHR